MDVHEFGKENPLKIVLIPGNMMCWRQFEAVIPLLEKRCHVAAVSTDGYDGTAKPPSPQPKPPPKAGRLYSA